jgi:hypothetical protein
VDQENLNGSRWWRSIFIYEKIYTWF